MNLKKLERYLRVNLLEPGPRLIKKNLPGRDLTREEKDCSKRSECTRRNSIWMTFVGHLVKMRKATISFVMSARPSLRMEQLSCHRADLREN